MGAGAIFFIFVFSIWGLFSFCNSYYRFYAIREAKENEELRQEKDESEAKIAELWAENKRLGAENKNAGP